MKKKRIQNPTQVTPARRLLADRYVQLLNNPITTINMDLIEIDEIDKLLKEFDTLPKTIKQSTYLELCKYPYNRFEEICSRLLCFYLSPTKEHGFKDLFLRSLLEILNPTKEIQYRFDSIKIIPEENAEGKRLDILIQSDAFVIGIENKITAGLYNPLDIYKNRIALYHENIFCILLSLKPISSKDELNLLKANNFKNLTYSEFFGRIKYNLGNYINECNSKYLIFLTDFIQTIENMNGQNILNPLLSNFFYDNSERIENLIDLFNEYNRRTTTIINERITCILENISEITKVTWSLWEGFYLYYKFNGNKPAIGIEAYFESSKENVLDKFIITITTWTLKDWNYYEKIILTKFPTKKLEKDDNRAVLYMDTISNNDEGLILKTLETIYDYLFDLTRD